MEKFLIVGLGNIGAEYAHTRHNIGFDVADALAAKHEAKWQTGRLAETCTIKLKGRSVLLIKPSTYMNLSGRAFRYWMDAEKITIKNTITVVDDIALPLDKIRIRPSGSDAGHNGLKDIQMVLGTDVYPKLRFGIGNDYPKGRQVDFVLGHWKPDEKPLVIKKIQTCIQVLEDFVLMGIEDTMNKYNKLVFKP